MPRPGSLRLTSRSNGNTARIRLSQAVLGRNPRNRRGGRDESHPPPGSSRPSIGSDQERPALWNSRSRRRLTPPKVVRGGAADGRPPRAGPRRFAGRWGRITSRAGEGTPSTSSLSRSREMQLLDLVEQLALLGQDEREGDAVLAHPAGPADPVDVVRRVVGQVEVHDVRDALDVDPAADDVGRHQGRQAAGAERQRGPGSAATGSGCRASCRRGRPSARSIVADLIGTPLGPAEDDGTLRLLAAPGA